MVQYSGSPYLAFAAVADSTRRGILARLGRGEASISDLAADFAMTLTGIKKHVAVLEEVGLVRTAKVGRVRTCRLGERRLDEEARWLRDYQAMVEARFQRLDAVLGAMEDEPCS
jgi:DNA-binding transcriptional ArsR family regulator